MSLGGDRKTLELQPVGLQVLCIIGSSSDPFNSGSNSIFQREVFRRGSRSLGCLGAMPRRSSGPTVKDEACDFSFAGWILTEGNWTALLKVCVMKTRTQSAEQEMIRGKR